MPTKLFTSKATYPNNIVIPPVALRHPAYYSKKSFKTLLLIIVNKNKHKRQVEGSCLETSKD